MGAVMTAAPVGGDKKPDHELDELEMQMVRYKPQGLDTLCRATRFNRTELKIMYRGFKQACPTGIVNEDSFKEIYGRFFPQGDANSYAHYVFNTFDTENKGIVNFEEFMVGLSVLARGSLAEKLQWAFSLYDINKDGVISRGEMLDIISAIYDMMGRYSDPHIDEHTAKDHVDRIFDAMDKNQDGVISEEEFFEACHRDEELLSSIVMFDTVL